MEVGKYYRIKYFDSKRSEILLYEGDNLDYPGTVQTFKAKGGNTKWYETGKYEVLGEVEPKSPKKKSEMKVCPRCLGDKYYERFSHIQGGVCFKCNGTGLI